MIQESIFDLSPAEKLQLVEDLWDDLSLRPSDVPVHDWQKDEVRRRKQKLMDAPATAITWEQVRARIQNHHAH